MMQHQVNVSARFNPETLERVLRVVRHRGFHVCSMNMAAASDAQNIPAHGRSTYCLVS